MIPPYTGLVPSRDDPANFSAAGDAFLSWLINTFVPAANILEQSLQWVGTTGTSDSLVAVGTGAKTWATQPDKAWAVGVWVYVVSASSMGNIMQGQVTAYDVETGELSVNVVGAAGAGSHADWIIGLAPAIAVAGSIGVTDAGGRFAGVTIEAVLTEVARLEGDMIKAAGDATHPLHLVPKQQLDEALANKVVYQPGQRVELYRSTIPAGLNLMKANGAAVSVATYAELTAAIYCGDANNATADWGYRCTDAANPSTTRATAGAFIVLPDARGRSGRGWSDGSSLDSGRSLWAYQAPFAGTFTVSASPDDGDGSGGSFQSVTAMNFNGQVSVGNGSGSGTVTVTAGDTRGANDAFLVCIGF